MNTSSEVSNAWSPGPGQVDGKKVVLLVEDNPGDVRIVKELFRDTGTRDVRLESVGSLAEASARLGAGGVDAALADLGLPDSQGLETCRRLRERAGRTTAIIVLTGNQDEEIGLAAIREGADDYLIKGQISGPLLVRAIKYSLERKRVEEALRAKNEELRSTSQQLWQLGRLATMGELAASIAHELNNPLATVSLRIEMLMMGMPEDDPNQQVLQVIENEVDRMAKLVANLLQFSRRNTPQGSTLDIREEIESSLELIQYHLKKQAITVVLDFPSDLPLIQADRQHLRQLFLNLFTNAADAMQGSGTLTIRVHHNEKVQIEVIDTGVGIEPGHLAKVMEPFFTTKPQNKGTGLGLPICQRIAREHGGELKLASEPGRGTTVLVTLPIQSKLNGTMIQESV